MPKHPGRFKDFGTRSAAARAIDKHGLNLIPHRVDPLRSGSTFRYQPVFFPMLDEDRAYVRSKGFKALSPEFA